MNLTQEIIFDPYFSNFQLVRCRLGNSFSDPFLQVGFVILEGS